MKLIPKYSYEYNKILNEEFNEDEQIKNFASLLSDKDRFLALLPLIEINSKLIEDRLGFKLKDEIDFFVVRAEKFKSFSEPITIEYSLLPEEMLIYLLKEVIKTSITERFPDDISFEQHVNSFVDFILSNGDFGKKDLLIYGKLLHDNSSDLIENYKIKEIDFKSKKMIEYIVELYN